MTIPANMDSSIALVKSIDTNPEDVSDSAKAGAETSDPSANHEFVAAKSRAAQAIISAKRALRKSQSHKE